jgi:hypothetical protein
MHSNHLYLWLRKKGILVLSLIALLVVATPGNAKAAGNDFDIQVSPSPLVVTLKPGKQQTTSLAVRNLSNHPETLYPKLNGFTFDKNGKNIKLLETAPAVIGDWTHFKAPSVTIAPGASQNVDIMFDTPATAGFSYSFAITLSRNPNDNIQKDGVSLKGSVAVFTLVNIDRPGAKRALSIDSLKTDHSSYQYLPATVNLQVRNSGNVIDQPQGTIYIQRTFSSNKPIATLPVNANSNYVLPGTSRTFSATWNSGFPRYVTDTDGGRHLSWDWKHLGDLRFGRYVAKVVVIYNDGTRDVPVIASYSFWVIPWVLIIGTLVILIILGMGIIGWGRLIVRGTKKVRFRGHRR